MSTLEKITTAIRFDDIVVGKNIRDFKESELQDLKDSITSYGLLQPIKLHPTDDNKFRVIFGHRRFAALKSLGRTQLEYDEYEFLETDNVDIDENDIADIQAQENLIRKNMHPLEEYSYFQDLMRRFDGDLTKVSTIASMPIKYIELMLTLGNLSIGPTALFFDNKITLDQAFLLVKLDADTQEALIGNLLDANREILIMSENEFREFIKKYSTGLDRAKFDINHDYGNAPACTDCPYNSTNQKDGLLKFQDWNDNEISKCLKATCYEAKTKIALTDLIKQARKLYGNQTKKLVREWYEDDVKKGETNIRSFKSWNIDFNEELPEACEHIVWGKVKGFNGYSIFCSNDKCPVHKETTSSGKKKEFSAALDKVADMQEALERREYRVAIRDSKTITKEAVEAIVSDPLVHHDINSSDDTSWIDRIYINMDNRAWGSIWKIIYTIADRNPDVLSLPDGYYVESYAIKRLFESKDATNKKLVKFLRENYKALLDLMEIQDKKADRHNFIKPKNEDKTFIKLCKKYGYDIDDEINIKKDEEKEIVILKKEQIKKEEAKQKEWMEKMRRMLNGISPDNHSVQECSSYYSRHGLKKFKEWYRKSVFTRGPKPSDPDEMIIKIARYCQVSFPKGTSIDTIDKLLSLRIEWLKSQFPTN